METSVEQFLKSVRNAEVVKKTENKNKTVVKNPFRCDVCNVNAYDIRTFAHHLNGRKHRNNVPFSKSCEGIKYIQRYEQPDDSVVIKCELCAEQLLDTVKHLHSSSHIQAFLKANHPKVLKKLQYEGALKISGKQLKTIVLEQICIEKSQQYVGPNNPEKLKRLFFETKNSKSLSNKIATSTSRTVQRVSRMGNDNIDKKIKRHKDCEPPQKMPRMDDSLCNDVSATISDHMRDHNEKKCCTSDVEREITSDCQENKACSTGSNLEDSRFEIPYKITCNDDLYNFLQYFQISDETDVIFIQQLVEKFKSQLQEFNETAKEEKEVLGLNGSKNQEKSKLKIPHPAENIVQQADSTTPTTSDESISNSTDIVDRCEDEVTTSSIGSDLPVCDASNRLSIDKLKSMIEPSVLSSTLKSRELPLESDILIKKEPDTVASDECQVSTAGYTDDASSITFGGKKNMHISEVIAEVAKFANTKPILKGIDINQVVRLLIQNRTEKSRKGSHNSTS